MIIDVAYLSKFAEYDNHKLVVKIENKKALLKGFIAIHNDNLGPATGGTRMFPYSSEKEAINDVLRLSRAMTYKCALAGVNYGGGKAVIIGDPQKIKNRKLLHAYAREVNKLNGQFTTGEDVGISEEDVQVMFQVSPFFNGKRGLAGDPSPYAALSTFFAIQTACRKYFGIENIKKRTIAVKGVGKVGFELIRLLQEKDAVVYAADVDPNAIRKVRKNFPRVTITSPQKIHKLKVDIYSPCAMGKEFTNITKNQVKAKIICGSANNQLSCQEIGNWFYAKGILYIPDYVANAGGLINVIDEREPSGYNIERVMARIKNIKNTVAKIIELSQKEKKSTVQIADELAESRIRKKKLIESSL